MLYELILKYSNNQINLGDMEKFSKLITKNDCIVEIGTFHGLTTIFLSRYAKKVISVDNYSLSDFDYIKSKNYLEQFGNIEIIKNDSAKYLTSMENDTIDILYIDGGHSYNQVKYDYEAGFNKVKNNGIIMFHDYIKSYKGICDFINNDVKNNKSLIELDIETEYHSSIIAFRKIK